MATSLSSIRKNGVLPPGNLPTTTTIPVAQISDAGTTGKGVLLSDTPSLARSAMGLGSAATSAITDFATAAQGIKANNAIPTSDIGITVAGLTGGKLLASVLPSIAVVDYLGSVASQAAMLALVGQRGDWCIRSDLGTTWIITGDTPTSISSWTQLSYPATGGNVTSVAGKTGVVTLTTADISGLGSAALLNATSLVTTVAGRSGAVTLSTADISGLGTAATLNATSLVTTVAGRSGAVTLSTTDITGLGTAATTAATDYATAAQGTKADSALQAVNIENTLTSVSVTNALSAAQGKALKDTADALAVTVSGKAASSHTHDPSQITGVTGTGTSLITASDPSTARTVLGVKPNLGVFSSIANIEAAHPAASNAGAIAYTQNSDAPLVGTIQPLVENWSDGETWRSTLNGGMVDFIGLFTPAEQAAMRTDVWTGIDLLAFATKVEKIWDLYSYKTWLVARGQCYIKCARPLRYYGRLFLIGLTDGIGNGFVIYPDLSIDWQTTFPKRGVVESANYQYPTLPPNRTSWQNSKPDFIAQSRFQCIDIRCAHDSANWTLYPNRVPDFGMVVHCANEGWTADRVNVRNARRANWLFSAYQSTPTLYNCGSWLAGQNTNTVFGDGVTRTASAFVSPVYVYADVSSVASATILLEAATATDLDSIVANNILTIAGVNYTVSSLTATKTINQNTMILGTLTTTRYVRQVTFSTSIAAYAASGRQFSCGLLHSFHPDGAAFAVGQNASNGGQGSGGLIVLNNFSGDAHRDSLMAASVNGTIAAHGTKSEQNPSTYMAWGSANGGAKPKLFLGGYRMDHSGTDQSAIRCIGHCRPSIVSTGGQCNISHVKFIEDLTSAATGGVANSIGGIGLVAWCADGTESTYIHRMFGQRLSLTSDISAITMEALSSASYRSQWTLAYSGTNTYTFKVGASGSEKNLIEVDGANGTAVRLNVYNGATVVNRITYNNIGLSFNGATPIAKPAITGDRNSGAATASLITQLANLGLVTDSTTATFQSVGRISGTLIDGTAVTITLSTLGLVGVPANIRVMPDSGSTVLIESSTDGSTYTTVISATADYSTTWFPTAGATNITHLRFTRSAGTGVTSGYHVY